eukprot:125331-Rhodomonas_salina.1
MTRAWDREEGFDDAKNVFKTAWYLPWIDHLKTYLTPLDWSVRQFNLTVGVQATIPLRHWSACMNFYGIPPTAQYELNTTLAEVLMEGGIEVLQAYKSHRRSRHERDTQNKATRAAGGGEG